MIDDDTLPPNYDRTADFLNRAQRIEHTCEKSGTNNDRWLTEIVYPGLKYGSYIELGAGHWKNESASWPLEKLNWEGISLEPQFDLYREFIENRFNPCLNAALWTHSGFEYFIALKNRRFRSGLALARNLKQTEKDNRDDCEVIPVPTITWNDLLRDFYPWPGPKLVIEAVIMDIERAERYVLPRFPFDTFKVGAWIIETDDPPWLQELMNQHGYINVSNPLNTSGRHNQYFLSKEMCDAISKREAASLDVGQQARDGEEVGRGGEEGHFTQASTQTSLQEKDQEMKTPVRCDSIIPSHILDKDGNIVASCVTERYAKEIVKAVNEMYAKDKEQVS